MALLDPSRSLLMNRPPRDEHPVLCGLPFCLKNKAVKMKALNVF